MSSASFGNSSAAPGPSLARFHNSVIFGGSVLWNGRYSIKAASRRISDFVNSAAGPDSSYRERQCLASSDWTARTCRGDAPRVAPRRLPETDEDSGFRIQDSGDYIRFADELHERFDDC